MAISDKMRKFYTVLGETPDYDSLKDAEDWFNEEVSKGGLSAADAHEMRMTLAFGKSIYC